MKNLRLETLGIVQRFAKIKALHNQMVESLPDTVQPYTHPRVRFF